MIRKLRPEETALLEDFLYQAIFVPQGVAAPPKSIVQSPDLQVYIKDFGKFPDDSCFVAEINGKIVGAVWVRIMQDYGHVDDKTPSLAISLYKEYRHQGIGTALMQNMLNLLKQSGYKQVSLSVKKENFATRMYLNLGFSIIRETDEEYIMVCTLT